MTTIGMLWTVIALAAGDAVPPGPSEAEVSLLDGLTGVTWVAEGEGFSTRIEYRWTVPDRVLEGANEIRDADGAVRARYSGLYAWDGEAGGWVLWNASASGEIQHGPVTIDGRRIWHRVDVRGGSVDAYTSVMEVVDGGLRFRIVYGDRTAAEEAVLRKEALAYRPGGTS